MNRSSTAYTDSSIENRFCYNDREHPHHARSDRIDDIEDNRTNCRIKNIALSRATITKDQIAPATRTSLVHDLRKPNHSETLDLSNQIESNTAHTNHVVDIDSLDEFMIQEITKLGIPPEELKSSMQKIFLESPFLAQSAIEEQPLHLEHMPFDIPGREELVRIAITKDGYALEHASPDEKRNRELVLLSLDNFSYDEDYGSPLAYADPILHSDPILLEAAINAPDTTPPLFFNGLHDYTSETVYRALETLGAEALETANRELLDDQKIYQWVRENYRFRACSNILGAIMPNSFFNDRDWIIQTLKNNGQFLEELPAPINQDPEFLNIAKQSGLGSALYNFDHEFKRHLNSIIEFQVFDVLPESIIYPETITFEHISNAVHYCPTQLAVAITAHAIENKNIDNADLILFQISSDTPTHKMLAITTAIPAESVIMADTNKQNIATQLYQDPYVFTHVPNAVHYINAMSNWLQPLGVKVYHANDLLSRERCAALFDPKNQNAVLFISSKDLDNFSSGLNGLLESGTWTVDDCTDSIKARIVVVGDKRLLKQDILSRLNRHSDVQALISAKTETPTEATYSKRTENSTPLKTIFDAKELLDTRFVSVRECFESINECGKLPNAPILISDESEIPLLEDALPSELTTCYKPSKYPIGTNPIPMIAYQNAPCHSLILLDNSSNVDSMIDYFLAQVGTASGITTSDILKNTKVYLNGCTNTNLLTAVYRDKNGIQNLIYRGDHYPVQGVCYSRLNPNPEEIQLDSALHQLIDDNDQDTLRHYYQQSPLDTSTDCANAIYYHLAQFIVNQKPVIIFEGPPGIGKDALTGHFLNQLQTLKYSGICCHHITAGYDLSLIDELLRLRTETPEKLIILAVSEGNLYDSAHWKEALLMIGNDRNIKIVTTQNATSMGGRFDLKTLFKDAVVRLDYDLSRAADINQPSNAKHHLTHASAAIIKDLHHKLSAEFKESITNRQLAAILRVFTESKLESFIQYYEALYRCYGLHLPECSDIKMSSLTGCGELCYETPLRAPLTTSSRITDSDNYFDDSDSGPKPVWSGKWSSYLTDNLFGIEKIKEVNTEQTHTRITQISDVTLPGEKIDLMRFPGKKKLLMAATPIDIDRPYSAQWLPFQPRIEDIARSSIHGITLQNNFSTPMRFSLFLEEPTPFLSQVRDNFTTERDNSLVLDEVETLFIDEIIKHQTNKSKNPINTEYTDQPSPHEDRLLALSKILDIKDPNNTKEVALTIFDCLNRFSQGKFTKRPALHSDLPKKYIHLAHAFLSRRGVCRHQSEILHTFLKLYGIKSTIHHNHNHSFAVFSDNTIVDLNYFTSPFKQHSYEQLCVSESIIREASHQGYNLPDDVETLLQEAKTLILDPHHPDATLERIDACTKALELASPKNQSSNTNTRILKEPLPSRPTSPVSVINEFTDNRQIRAEKPDITPSNILALLAERAVAPSDILKSINKSKSESYLPWIQAAFNELVMKRRKSDISEGQYIEIPNLINERKQLLTAIVSSMLEELPQGKRVVRYCLPHTDNINLQARAKKVGGAYMVSMVIPAGGNDKTITVSPPTDFAEPFVLLTAHQPVLISSPEMLAEAYDNTEPLSLTEDEQHIFMAVVDEIVGTAKPSHQMNNTLDL